MKLHALLAFTAVLVSADRALLAAYSERAQRITPDMVRSGAASLDLAAPRPSMMGWLRTQAARIF